MNYYHTITRRPTSIRNFSDQELLEISNWIKSKKHCVLKPKKKRKLTEYNKYMSENLIRFNQGDNRMSQQDLFRLISKNWTIIQQTKHPCKQEMQSSMKSLACPSCDGNGNVIYTTGDPVGSGDEYIPYHAIPFSDPDIEDSDIEDYVPAVQFSDSDTEDEWATGLFPQTQ